MQKINLDLTSKMAWGWGVSLVVFPNAATLNKAPVSVLHYELFL